MVGRRSHSNESGRSAAAPFFFSVRKTGNMNCSCARVPNAEAQYPRNFPNASLHPGREAPMPHPTWQEFYNAALVEFDLAKLPERVEAACQAIHQHRSQKGHTLTAEERKALDDALRVLFTLMQRAA
jgi:hypothetical protein